MPFVRIWVHIVWSTKNREPLLSASLRPIIFDHIRENALKKGIFLAEVNGYHDHVHCLISLKRNQTIAKVAQLLKGESSRWTNYEGLVPGKLFWQTEYYAASVGESEVKRVRNYIRNQEAHHARQSFFEETKEMMAVHGFAVMEDWEDWEDWEEGYD